jgi:hypothetical protein
MRRWFALAFLMLAPHLAMGQEVNVRVELVEIWCDNTEDVTGADELYVTSALKSGSIVKAVVTKPIDINDGQTKKFPADESIIFDAKVPKAATIVGGVVLFDEDYGKDWEKKDKKIAENVKASADKIADAVGGAPKAIVGAITQSVYTVVDLLAQGDKDDRLGALELSIPAEGPPEENKEFTCEEKGIGFSTWKYTLRYRIIRN